MQKKATQKRRAKAKAKKKAQIAASPSQIAKLVDEQKEHELAASEKYKLWLERALKKEALREKDRNRKQCERARNIGVAPTISAPTISVRIKNVVGVPSSHNSWRL